jgi:hypothetical protein
MTDIATLGERALRRLGVAVVPVADRPPLATMIAPDTIATDALVELGVIAADEVPSPADLALAQSKLAAVQDSLTSQALVWWDNTGIPSALREEYTKMTAAQMATAFGKQADPAVYALLENRVRRMALVFTGPERATEAVQAVHDDLTARGRARWSVFDLPPAAELPYELLAANRLAPLFEKPADAAADVLAMRSLAQIIALPSSGERVVAEYF